MLQPAASPTHLDSAIESRSRFRSSQSRVGAGLRVILGAVLLLALSLGSWLGWMPIAQAVDYNRESLVDHDFSNQDLTDASFTKANMRGANLSNSNVSGVSFFSTNLEDANLSGANLTNATLDSARLVHANLTNAILEGAFAFSAKFNGATIDGADFTDVLMRDDMQELLCQVAQGTNPVTQRDTRSTLECE